MIHRLFSRALLGATALAAAAIPATASAQHVDRIVAFGDSYADDGNLFQLFGIAPPLVYSTGRFSGGTNYVDTLSAILGVPVQNFAIGGAQTGNGNQTPGAPGFQFEIASFLAGGGGVFPTVTPTFDEGDLVTVSIGGNDARAYQLGGGSLAGAPAAANAAAANATIGLDALVAAGAPTISFLAGNTALLPEVFGLPDPAAAQAVRNLFSTTFNSSVQQSLAGYADDGVIVHYLDLSLVLQQIAANPGAYGLQSTGPCPLAQASLCVADPAFANQYLFYVDALHLSSRGFAIVGQYVATQLAAPLTLQAPSDLGQDLARQWGTILGNRADFGLDRVEQGATGTRFFVLGDTFSRDVDESDSNNAFDIDGVGGTIGAEMAMGGGVVGIAANYTRPRVRFGTDDAKIDGRSWQVGAYGAAGLGAAYVQGFAGYGRDRLRIDRAGVVEDMRARPRGSHVTFGGKAGYRVSMGALQIGPVVGLDYTRARVRGYTETGDPALTLTVGRQSLKSLTGQVGVELQGDLDAGGGSKFRPFASVAAEHDFTGDGRLITFAQTASPIIVNRWDIGGEKQTYARFNTGLSADLWSGANLDAAVTATVGQDGGDELGANVGFSLGF